MKNLVSLDIIVTVYLSAVVYKNWTFLDNHLRFIIIFDAVILTYYSAFITLTGLTFVFAISSFYIAFGSYLIELDAKLINFIQSWNTITDINRLSFMKRLIDNLFVHFQSKYVYIFTTILRINDNLVSKVMWVTMVCNFSLNIYAVTLLTVRKNLLPEEMGFLTTNLLSQVYLLSMACLIFIQFAEKFYLSKQSIFRLASFPTIPFHGYLLKSTPHLKSKIRLALFNEKINTIKPFRFKAGWIGVISKQTVSQFLIFYITHLMLSLNFVNK